MDNLNSLLPGFRFHPTDEELIVHYLNPKVLNSPLPADVILEISNVCQSDPWNLPGGSDGERYFFSSREVKDGSGNRCSRGTLSGYWKATGNDKKIAASGEAQRVVGIRKTLAFYKGKPSNSSKTDWIMHEYRLADAPQANLVLCRIFFKKRGNSSRAASVIPAFRDFFAAEGADLNLAPSSSSSSRSSPVSDHQEATSCSSFMGE
ncbi:PREDICTED: NAC domain-containing protein 83-like [Ipomoea nil]|uniref:NAC domain-containing protein 83-like n=1 Tax=Ipomoea nil TaxID=35883 RepID=UPI0009010C78|nr:PREDICTED: NAC domain-containing protein 83-like [Ipomoea nil]